MYVYMQGRGAPEQRHDRLHEAAEDQREVFEDPPRCAWRFGTCSAAALRGATTRNYLLDAYNNTIGRFNQFTISYLLYLQYNSGI